VFSWVSFVHDLALWYGAGKIFLLKKSFQIIFPIFEKILSQIFIPFPSKDNFLFSY